MVTEVTMIQSQGQETENDTVTHQSDASDEEADVSHAWTADLACNSSRNRKSTYLVETE